MRITVVGIGYVGLSLSLVLSQEHQVLALDIDIDKVNSINDKKTPIKNEAIENFFLSKNLNLSATTDKKSAYSGSDFVIVSTPTNYSSEKESFDTLSVENTIEDSINYNPNATIVIKSTVPIGFTDRMKKKFNFKNIFFSPEFLREGNALLDNLKPTRIIIGDKSKNSITFSEMLLSCSNVQRDNLEILFMTSKEAEAVKLFSNTYLAMRVSFFNELDTFAEVNKLNSKSIINGVSTDPRIGNYYNNPSFGYGGYCLPKDTKQLLNNYENIPNDLIKAIIQSNQTRKKFIANSIIAKSPKTVGIHRLTMKKDSNNFRESAILDVIDLLRKREVKIILYEPIIEASFNGIKIIKDLNEFISLADIIVSNRFSKDLELINNKVYCRDIFYID
jgi:UDPglucose 6-dehydrogenase